MHHALKGMFHTLNTVSRVPAKSLHFRVRVRVGLVSHARHSQGKECLITIDRFPRHRGIQKHDVGKCHKEHNYQFCSTVLQHWLSGRNSCVLIELRVDCAICLKLSKGHLACNQL